MIGIDTLLHMQIDDAFLGGVKDWEVSGLFRTYEFRLMHFTAQIIQILLQVKELLSMSHILSGVFGIRV